MSLLARIDRDETVLSVERRNDRSGEYVITTSDQVIEAISLAHVWLILTDLMEQRDPIETLSVFQRLHRRPA